MPEAPQFSQLSGRSRNSDAEGNDRPFADRWDSIALIPIDDQTTDSSAYLGWLREPDEIKKNNRVALVARVILIVVFLVVATATIAALVLLSPQDGTTKNNNSASTIARATGTPAPAQAAVPTTLATHPVGSSPLESPTMESASAAPLTSTPTTKAAATATGTVASTVTSIATGTALSTPTVVNVPPTATPIPTFTLAPVPPTFTAAPAPRPLIYIVRPGDTLFFIARRYGTTVDALVRVNNLRTTSIYTGQQLAIP